MSVSEEQKKNERKTFHEKALHGLATVGCYVVRKVKETTGLQLTKVQEVYWRAVQRRMILSQLESLINDNLELIKQREIKVPYELAMSLMKCDPAIENYLPNFLHQKDIEIAPPRQKKEADLEETDGGSPTRLLSPDEPDTGRIRMSELGSTRQSRSIHPMNLVKYMKDRGEVTENEEEALEDKGGFLKQAWLALKFLKNRCVKQRQSKDGIQTDGAVEEVDFHGMTDELDMDDISYDEDDELLLERFYDREMSSSPIHGSQGQEIDGSARLPKVLLGTSHRPAWRIITDIIPFVVSNFRFQYIMKTTRRSDYEEEWAFQQAKAKDRTVSQERHDKLRKMWHQAARWPLFTYWLMFVQTLILIITLSFYGFAPLRYYPFTETALVTQADLSVVVLEKRITPNIWAGPPRDALVLLGANYGPCMRRDQALYDVIEVDRSSEASQSGCCVRRDGSGCVQVPSERECPTRTRLADFVFTDPAIDTELYTNRSVCGTSPRTCTSPPASSGLWRSTSISDWPICLDSSTPPPNSNGTNEHLTCAITGRPCCVGIQALCVITTRENCDFLEGNFHEDAFLCSQVDCLKAICGLTPFAEPDHPDQSQRWGLALFLHAGIFHLILTLIFDVLILRNLEKYLGWLSTSILYLGSGIGGNVISGIFVPYSPEVGPASSIFGVIAFFFVFIFYHWEMLYRPGLEMLKYLGILIALIFIGIFPYVDNYGRLGGILFGLLLSFIHIHYIPKWEWTEEFERFKKMVQGDKRYEDASQGDSGLVIKKVLLAIGIMLIIPLYIFSFTWFYTHQNTWSGFTYLNCIIPTSVSDLCVDFGQTIQPRNISNLKSF